MLSPLPVVRGDSKSHRSVSAITARQPREVVERIEFSLSYSRSRLEHRFEVIVCGLATSGFMYFRKRPHLYIYTEILSPGLRRRQPHGRLLFGFRGRLYLWQQHLQRSKRIPGRHMERYESGRHPPNGQHRGHRAEPDPACAPVVNRPFASKPLFPDERPRKEWDFLTAPGKSR